MVRKKRYHTDNGAIETLSDQHVADAVAPSTFLTIDAEFAEFPADAG